MGNKSRVKCSECGDRVPIRQSTAIRDESGNLIGYLCRDCYQSA